VAKFRESILSSAFSFRIRAQNCPALASSV
jgi:hypothetical protein